MIQRTFPFLFASLLAVPFSNGIAQETKPRTITVFAAASLNEVFTAMAEKYKAENPGEEITFNFAGSQQLVQQIAEGGQVDIFASANMKQMAIRVFAHNKLIVVYPRENKAGIHSLRDLSNPHLKIVLADSAVPVGQYSVEFLEKCTRSPGFDSAFKKNVLGNVVSYEENVKAVLSKVVLGEADAGIVYCSDVSKHERTEVGTIDIPELLNVLATYPIAMARTPVSRQRAQKFIQYILSDKGQAILVQFGFLRSERSRLN